MEERAQDAAVRLSIFGAVEALGTPCHSFHSAANVRIALPVRRPSFCRHRSHGCLKVLRFPRPRRRPALRTRPACPDNTSGPRTARLAAAATEGADPPVPSGRRRAWLRRTSRRRSGATPSVASRIVERSVRHRSSPRRARPNQPMSMVTSTIPASPSRGAAVEAVRHYAGLS
jgi:hypothetical protein